MKSLTQEQKHRLKTASSGLHPDQFAKLTLAESNAIASRIDKVVYDLHQEAPFAFKTVATWDGVHNKPVFHDRGVGIDFFEYSFRK